MITDKPTDNEFKQSKNDLEKGAFEHKLAEKLLYKSEENYRLLVKNIPSIVYKGYKDWSVEFFDKKIEALTCYSADEFNSRKIKWIDIIVKDDIPALINNFALALKTDKSFVRDYRIKSRDGNINWIQERGQIICDGKNHIKYITGVFFDITQQKRSEDLLRKSEKKYRTLLETTLEGYWLLNSERKTIEVNQALCRMLGYSQDEMLGKTPFDFVDDENRKIFIEQISKISSSAHRTYEITLKKKNGQNLHTHFSTTTIRNKSGEVQGSFAFITDITEKKQAQEERDRLAVAIEQAAESAFITDRGGMIQYVNPAFQRLTGYSPKDVIGRHLRILRSGKHDASFYEKIWHTLTRGNAWRGRIINRKKNGDLYEADAKISPVLDKSGKITNFVSIKRDITHEIKFEKRLIQAQKMESLGTLVSGVAHEINNPINLILFNTSVLQNIWKDFQPVMKQQAKKEPNRKYGGLSYSYIEKKLDHLLSDTGMASGRIVNIVSGLKHFARQTDIADKKPMQINEAVNNAIKLAQTTLRKSQVTLNLELAHNLPLIEGNIQSIEQIILNLIINAIQSIEHNEGKISIITEFQKKKNKIIVSISDNGKGVDSSLSERIFDPFITDKLAQGGTGLGLSVTYTLVKSHDGEIVFKSRQGKGTTFIVSFPTKQVELTAKILIADDKNMIRDMLKEVLAEHPSYLVEDVGNGIETCIKLGTFHPDLLILDINMPGMDGLEVCRIISKDPDLSSIKVMIITGYPDDSRVKQVAKLGYTHIYTKPLHLKVFLKEIDSILKEPKHFSGYGIHSHT